MITLRTSCFFGHRKAQEYTNTAILHGLFNDVLSQMIEAEDERTFHWINQGSH
jgi:hypothetical protein